jgi:hypothetical protein
MRGSSSLMPNPSLRILWILQYQKLLFHWADLLNGLSEEEAKQAFKSDKIAKITSLNIPGAIIFGTR